MRRRLGKGAPPFDVSKVTLELDAGGTWRDRTKVIVLDLSPRRFFIHVHVHEMQLDECDTSCLDCDLRPSKSEDGSFAFQLQLALSKLEAPITTIGLTRNPSDADRLESRRSIRPMCSHRRPFRQLAPRSDAVPVAAIVTLKDSEEMWTGGKSKVGAMY